MNFLYVLGGIIAIALGVWLTVYAAKQFQKETYDTTGWRIQFLIMGITIIICGIIVIAQHI